jgi:hypothetical protein
MKKLKLMGLGLLIMVSSFGQYDSPAVEWKINDIPPHNPHFPITIPVSNAPEHQPGVDLLDPNHQYPTHRSGEDWWYSILPHPSTGGYLTSGFATWLYYDLNEKKVGGCKNNEASRDTSFTRPYMSGERLSNKLATMALYDKNGVRVWCKPFFHALEGAISSAVDADGNIVFTGYSSSTMDVDGNPINYNPTVGNTGTQLTGALCEANAIKAVVAKVNNKGDLLWAYSYAMYDLGINDDQEVLGIKSKGYDIVVDNDGNYVMTGTQYIKGASKTTAFLLKLNKDGAILNRYSLALAASGNTISRSISMYGDSYLIGGGATLNEGMHGYVVKFDKNLQPVSSFGSKLLLSEEHNPNAGTINTLNIAAVWFENKDYEALWSKGRKNIVFDTKELRNGTIAVVSVEDCNNGEWSGNNIGIGYLRILNQYGSGKAQGVTTPHPIRLNQSGDGYLTAFDLKIGIEPVDPDEIVIITTVKDDNGQNLTTTPEFKQSMEIISGKTSKKPEDFIGKKGNFGSYTPRGLTYFSFNYAQTSALLSHYSVTGDLNWEKIIDGDDAPLQVYPGDWKEQECVYNVMKGTDGEYVFVGNTSHNKDDYFVAKVYSPCAVNDDYYIKPDNPVVNNVIDIDGGGIVEWNPATLNRLDINVRGEIHIKEGTTLRISGGLKVHFADGRQMDLDTRLIVEQGAVLEVDNATLTSLANCTNAMWKGIEVWGTSDEPQSVNSGYPLQQGLLRLRNNATIENAIRGVVNWKPGDWSSIGGIISASAAVFRNNTKSVHLMKYDYMDPNDNYPRRYLAFFTKCIFEINDDYIGLASDKFFKHIDLVKVRGVDFSGCQFINQGNPQNTSIWNSAIFSHDAHFYVRTACNSSTIPCPEQNIIPSTFTGFNHAIFAESDGSTTHNFNVNNAIFRDNEYGIKMRGVNNASILFNQFDLGKAWDCKTSFGIYSEYGTGFTISENTFSQNNVASGNTYLGVHIKDTDGRDLIYRNTFSNLTVGNKGEGNNVTTGSADFGLEYQCNTNTGNKTDFYIDGELGDMGAQADQGTVAKSSGNTFSSSGVVNLYSRHQKFNYYYAANKANEVPQADKTFNVNTYEASGTNACATKYGLVTVDGPSSSEVEYELSKNKFLTLEKLYLAGSSATKSDLLRGEMIVAKKEYLDIINNSIQEIMQNEEMDYEAFRLWQGRIETYSADRQIVSSFISQKKLDQALKFASSLINTYQLDAVAKEVHKNYESIIELYKNLYSKGESIFDISANALAQLKTIAENDNFAGSMAKSIVNQVTGKNAFTCLSTDVDVFKAQERAAYEANSLKINELSFTSFPIPAKEWVRFEYDLPNGIEKATLQITNFVGQKLIELVIDAEEDSKLVDVNHLQEGMYIVNLFYGEKTYSGKMLIVR